MDNLNLHKQTIKTHVAKSIRRLASIGLGINPMRVRFVEGEEKTLTAAEGKELVDNALAAANKGWYGGMSEENRTNATMQKFEKTGINDFAKSHIRLQGLINEKGVIVPKEGSDEITVKTFRSAIGVPDKPEGYVPSKMEGLHEGAKSQPESLKVFQEAAHKLGMTPSMFNGIYEMYLKDVSAKLTAWDDLQKEEFNKASTALRAEWGGNYENKQMLAAKVLSSYGGEDLLTFLKEKGIANDPRVLKVFATIGEHLSEDSLGKLGVSKLSMSVAEAQTKMDEMRADPKGAFMDDRHPGHANAVAYMLTLNEIKAGKNT